MKINVSTPMKGQEIIELLTGYEGGDYSYTFIEKKGLNHLFEVEGPDGEGAVALAKKLILETEFGKVLYFSVNVQ